MAKATTTNETSENMIKLGSSCISKDEAVKMGLLYIMILIIAFVL